MLSTNQRDLLAMLLVFQKYSNMSFAEAKEHFMEMRKKVEELDVQEESRTETERMG